MTTTQSTSRSVGPADPQVGRAALIEAGRAGTPRAFLAGLGPASFDRLESDPELALLVGANLLALGLPEPAEGVLEGVGHPAAAPARDALLSQARAAPRSAIPDEQLRAAHTAAARWCPAASAPLGPVYRTNDGGLVTSHCAIDCAIDGATSWIGLGADDRIASDHTPTDCAPTERPRTHAGPVAGLVAGGSDPWRWIRAMHRAQPNELGLVPRPLLIETNAALAHRALALAAVQLGAAAVSERIERGWCTLFVGGDAEESLAHWLEAHWTQPLPDGLSLEPGFDWVGPVLRRAGDAADDRHAEQRRSVAARYADRDLDYWRERLSARPSWRVLVRSTRFSTYVGHAAGDLARAIRDAGHEAILAIEPDQVTCSTTYEQTRVLLETDPDLVVTINHGRDAFDGVMPPNLPLVCWIQDAMPSWYDPSKRPIAGNFDFVAGYLDEPLRARLGVAPERCIPSENPVRWSTFSRPARDQDRPLECELAMVTNQSETIDQLVERVSGEVREVRDAPATLAAIAERIPPLVERSGDIRWNSALRELTDEQVASTLGGGQDLVELLYRCFTLPAADLLIRHQTAGWAADLAERRGWRFHLHGRGWESHPTLSRFARGAVEHGEALARVYGAAAVTVHVSSRSLLHQRHAECLAAGGFLLARRTGADAVHLFNELGAWLVRHGDDDRADRLDGGVFRASIVDHWPAMAAVAQLQRIGWAERFPVLRDGFMEFRPWHAENFGSLPAPEPLDRGRYGCLLDLAESTFGDRREFEELVERAIERPLWRRGLGDALRHRVARQFSLASFVDRIRATVGAAFEPHRSNQLGAETGERS